MFLVVASFPVQSGLRSTVRRWTKGDPYLPPDDAIICLWNLLCVKGCHAEQELRRGQSFRTRNGHGHRNELWTNLVHDDAAGPEIDLGAVRRELVFRFCGYASRSGTTLDAQPAASSFVRVFLFFVFEVQSLGM